MMIKKLLMAVLVVILLIGCGKDKDNSYKDVEAGVLNTYSYYLAYNYGNSFAAMSNYTYIPADGVNEALFAYDYNRVQASANDYGMQFSNGKMSDLSIKAYTMEQKNVYGFTTTNENSYKFKVSKGNLLSRELTIEALSEKKYVYKYLKDTYYWNNTITDFDPEVCADSYEVLDRVVDGSGGKDRWSFIFSEEENNNHNAGRRDGFGFWPASYKENNEYVLILVNVDKGSPFDSLGINRGDKIISINDQPISYWRGADGKYALYSNLMDSDTTTLKFSIIGKGEVNATDYEITKTEYTAPTVPVKKVFQKGNKKIGYILFTSFINNSVSELDTAAEYFINEGITDIVVDLRYNGGGLVYVSNYFASMLGGTAVNNQIFGKMIYNTNYNKFNIIDKFYEPKYKLSLNKITFITTENTASASELLINSLKPFREVKTIGTNSNGKFVGMFPMEFYDKVIYSINFAETNANNEFGNSTGIVPDIIAKDNYMYDYGDENEDSLKAALNYIDTGVIPVQSIKKDYSEYGKAINVSQKRNFIKIF